MVKATTNTELTVPRLKALYKDVIVKELKDELKLANVHQAPRITKVVISSGTGKKRDDKRYYEAVKNTLTRITGQMPIDRASKKSVASFKVRAGMSRAGLSVTLRDARMYEFLDRLINIALPRVRDFRGISAKAFDKSGNLNIGITEHSIFPELTFEETQVSHGLQITVVITGGNAEYSRVLLEKLGVPFERQGGNR